MKRWMRRMLDGAEAIPQKAEESLTKLTVRSVTSATIIFAMNLRRDKLIVFYCCPLN